MLAAVARNHQARITARHLSAALGAAFYAGVGGDLAGVSAAGCVACMCGTAFCRAAFCARASAGAAATIAWWLCLRLAPVPVDFLLPIS